MSRGTGTLVETVLERFNWFGEFGESSVLVFTAPGRGAT